jgi:hypothetical protein
MATLTEFNAERKAKDRAFFYGNEVVNTSNKYFRFNRVQDEDNVTILTSNIIFVKGSPLLVVGPQHVIYLKDWQLRTVRNYDQDIKTYAVKLSRNYFKVYTFRNEINDICVENEMVFDDFLNIAIDQTTDGMTIAEGW